MEKNVGGFVWVALVMVDEMRYVIFGVRIVISSLLCDRLVALFVVGG